MIKEYLMKDGNWAFNHGKATLSNYVTVNVGFSHDENPCYEVCLFALQTDDWSSLRKNKFHPPDCKIIVRFGNSWLPDGLSVCSLLIV